MRLSATPPKSRHTGSVGRPASSRPFASPNRGAGPASAESVDGAEGEGCCDASGDAADAAAGSVSRFLAAPSSVRSILVNPSGEGDAGRPRGDALAVSRSISLRETDRPGRSPTAGSFAGASDFLTALSPPPAVALRRDLHGRHVHPSLCVTAPHRETITNPVSQLPGADPDLCSPTGTPGKSGVSLDAAAVAFEAAAAFRDALIAVGDAGRLPAAFSPTRGDGRSGGVVAPSPSEDHPPPPWPPLIFRWPPRRLRVRRSGFGMPRSIITTLPSPCSRSRGWCRGEPPRETLELAAAAASSPPRTNSSLGARGGTA